MNNLNDLGCDIKIDSNYLGDLYKKNILNKISKIDFFKIINNVVSFLDKLIREKKSKNIVSIEKIMKFLIQLSKTKFSEKEEIYVILNNYYSLLLKVNKEIKNIPEKIKDILFFKRKSKNLNKKHFFGLFTNLASEFLIKTGKYNTTLKELKKSINFYESNFFFQKTFNQKEVSNIKKVYLINRMYLLICLKQYNIPSIEFEIKKTSLFEFCEKNFPKNKLFKNWIEKNFLLKKNSNNLKRKTSIAKKKKSKFDKNLTTDFENLSLQIKCSSSTNKKTDKKSNLINFSYNQNFIPFKLKDKNKNKKKLLSRIFLSNKDKKKNIRISNRASLNNSSKRKNNKYNTFFKFFKEDFVQGGNKKLLKSFKDNIKKKIIRAKLVEKLNFILSDEKKQIKEIEKINKKIIKKGIIKDVQLNKKTLNLFLKRKKKKLEISKNKNYFLKPKKKSRKLIRIENLENCSIEIKNYKNPKKNSIRKKRRQSSFRITKIKSKFEVFRIPFLNILLNPSKKKEILPQKIDIKYFYLKNKKYKYKIIFEDQKVTILVLRKKEKLFKKLLKIDQINFLLSQEKYLNILPPFLIKEKIKHLNQIFKYYLFHLMIFKREKVLITSLEDHILNTKKKKMDIIFNNLPNSILTDVELKRINKKYLFSMIYLTDKIFRILFYKKDKGIVKNCIFIDIKFTKKDIKKYFDIILINSVYEKKNIFENIISGIKIKNEQKDYFLGKLNFFINKNFENFSLKTKYCFFYHFIFMEDLQHFEFKFFKIKKTMRKNYFDIILYPGFENCSKMEISCKELKNYWYIKNNKIISEIEFECIFFYLVNFLNYKKGNILDISNLKSNISIVNSFKIFLSNFKIICRKKIFLKDIYLIPVVLNLIFITENQFIVQIIFNDLDNLEYQCRYFFLENLLNFWFENSSNKLFEREIILKFKKYDWENFLKKNLFLDENSLKFKTKFIFLNTLIIN